MSFDVNKVKQYFLARSQAELAQNPTSDQTAEQRAKEDFEQMPAENFNIRSIFSLFDKNNDGKITQNEFQTVSEAEYNDFTNNLMEYNKKIGRELNSNSIWSYSQLQSYLVDDEMDEDEVLCDTTIARGKITDCNIEDVEPTNKKSGNAPELDDEAIARKEKGYDFSGTYGKSEVFNLKDISQMSIDEIINELHEYKLETEGLNDNKLKNLLLDARRERAKHDIGSNELDNHIGTFVQNQDSKYCGLLQQLEGRTDEEIASMIKESTDDNGEKIYTITFPNGRQGVVSEKEFKSASIDYNGRTIADFPEGDADVTLITMGFVKAFGTTMTDKGAWAFEIANIFTHQGEKKYIDNQHLEDIDDFSTLPPHSQIGVLLPDEMKRKGLPIKDNLKDEDLSWISEEFRTAISFSEGMITTLTNGQQVCISKQGIFLENGTVIQPAHALSVRRYDAETKELIVTANEFGNLSETRIPIELAQYLETASIPGFPGADKTPQPKLEKWWE